MSSLCDGVCSATGTPLKYGWNTGRVQENIKAANYPKGCKLTPTLLLLTNRKSHIRFVDWNHSQSRWMTLNGRKVVNLAEIIKISGAQNKNLNEDKTCYGVQNVGL